MIENNLRGLNASQLRIVLLASIGVILVITGIGFYFIQSQLSGYAVTVSHASEDADTSVNDVAVLQGLQKKLADNQVNIQRTQNIVADAKSYKYQDQIISDLNTYASRSNISINSFVFDSGSPISSSAATTSTPVVTPGQAAPVVAGLKSTTVSVTLKTPTKYSDLMNLIHSIEQNLTKMQIASISLTKGSSSQDVSTNTLLIEVYIQ